MEQNKKLLSSFHCGGQTVLYFLNEKTGVAGMTLCPDELCARVTAEGAWNADNLVQIKLIGDSYPGGYAQGRHMHNSESTLTLRFEGQTAERDGEVTRVITRLKSGRVTARHTLTLRDGAPYMTVETRVENTSSEMQRMELLSSFCLCGLSPVGRGERMRDIVLHRLQSRWSGEGKRLSQRLTELHMEPSWSYNGSHAERFGQVGSMPVRGWFPWAVLEDTRYHWCVGAQLFHPGSWQMVLYNREDKVSLSGGLADREFGHFIKELKPGEVFDAPKAVIAACMGDVDDIAWCLTRAQEEALSDLPETEKELPVIFNEYCSTWGQPSAKSLAGITEAIRGHGFAYLVIDCGWFTGVDNGGVWYNTQGDWEVNEERFPGGFGDTVRRIREAGMIPGLWVETETVGGRSRAARYEAMQLKRDGLPLEDSGNRFWDMTDPKVRAYLDDRVIRLLKENGFGYIKVDYNGNYGIGVDGPESLGENLRRAVLAARDYFVHISEEIPGIVIENCASGGHRLEPSMMAVCSMASFSDAHECIQIPIIAANVQRAVLPRQSQIWAVLRSGDSDRRLYWSLINGLLGRLCVSGDVCSLSEAQWRIVDRCIAFYKRCAPVIRSGKTRRVFREDTDYSHPRGDQIVTREGLEEAEGMLLAVIHRFDASRREASAALPSGEWEIAETCCEAGILSSVEGNRLSVRGMEHLSACAVLLKKK